MTDGREGWDGRDRRTGSGGVPPHPPAGSGGVPPHPQGDPDAHLEAVAEKAAGKAIRDTFRLLGVDVADQGSVNSFRADLVSAHQVRRLRERGGTIALAVIVTALVTGGLAALWQGLRGGSGAP